MPIKRSEIDAIIAEDLAGATEQQRGLTAKYRTEPQIFPIAGDLRHTEVWVVARKDSRAIWYDDVEEGFNCSVIENGTVATPSYEQDTLGIAVWRWFR